MNKIVSAFLAEGFQDLNSKNSKLGGSHLLPSQEFNWLRRSCWSISLSASNENSAKRMMIHLWTLSLMVHVVLGKKSAERYTDSFIWKPHKDECSMSTGRTARISWMFKKHLCFLFIGYNAATCISFWTRLWSEFLAFCGWPFFVWIFFVQVFFYRLEPLDQMRTKLKNSEFLKFLVFSSKSLRTLWFQIKSSRESIPYIYVWDMSLSPVVFCEPFSHLPRNSSFSPLQAACFFSTAKWNLICVFRKSNKSRPARQDTNTIRKR